MSKHGLRCAAVLVPVAWVVAFAAACSSSDGKFTSGTTCEQDGAVLDEDGECVYPSAGEDGPDGGSAGGGASDRDGADAGDEADPPPERTTIYVSPGGSDEADGTLDDPLLSVNAAIEAATAAGLGSVTLCDGTYREQVVVDVPMMLTGTVCPGSDVPDDALYPAVLAPSEEGVALLVDGVAGTVAVRNIEVRAPEGATPGVSSIAVFVRGSENVSFTDSHLVAGDAADGVAGVLSPFEYPVLLPGNDGTETAGGSFILCECPDGARTSGGGGGSPMPGGQPGGTGTPDTEAGQGGTVDECLDNAGGHHGGAGDCGADGQGAAMRGELSQVGWTPADGEDGQNGRPGQGGGGGASVDSTGGAGGGSCGGCGGAAARAGRGGGSSIALMVYESSVRVDACTLATGEAGDGGDGAPGQAGQPQDQLGGNRAGGACNGGRGGPGGDGGASGGGAGGSSVGILFVGQAPQIDSVEFTLGDPGDAGAGGIPAVNDGVDGLAAETVDTGNLNEPGP